MKIFNFTRPSHVIIGIHGLKNKPPRRLLRRWWIASIQEGLRDSGFPERDFRFELVYWANHLYSKPLSPREKREGHPLFLEEPYAPAEDGVLVQDKKKRSFFLRPLFKKTLNKVFMSTRTADEAEKIADKVLEHTFPDLVLYYDNEHVFHSRLGIQELLRGVLKKTLCKYSDSKIMLIAHSMGSIISFDVLSVSPVEVAVFVTIGSPLGLPFVRKRFAEEHMMKFSELDRIAVPNPITERWVNIADTKDVVAFDSSLADNYSENMHGIAVEDLVTANNCISNGKPDHHSVYGYLRCREMAAIINQFLSTQHYTITEKIHLWWRKRFE